MGDELHWRDGRQLAGDTGLCLSRLSGQEEHNMQKKVNRQLWEKSESDAVVILLKLWFSKEWSEINVRENSPNKASFPFYVSDE